MAIPVSTGSRCPSRPLPLQDGHAVDFLIETLRGAPSETVTLCPLGPLTNIAAAFRRAPDIVARVQEIVLMGGAYFEVGNVTPAAEFNIYVDPEAARDVFASGVPITVMPLDVTHKVLTTRPRIDAFRALGTEVGEVVASWTDFFERFDMAKYGHDGAPLHDPCVIAHLVRPGLFGGRHVNVEIETQSDLTRGMTRGRLVGRDRPGEERDLHGRGGRGRVLRPAYGATGAALRLAALWQSGQTSPYLWTHERAFPLRQQLRPPAGPLLYPAAPPSRWSGRA